MWKIKNTATDRSKTHLHRIAPSLEMEPVVAGRRLFMGTSVTISEGQYQHDCARLKMLEKTGAIECVYLGGGATPVPVVPMAANPVETPQFEPPPGVEMPIINTMSLPKLEHYEEPTPTPFQGSPWNEAAPEVAPPPVAPPPPVAETPKPSWSPPVKPAKVKK